MREELFDRAGIVCPRCRRADPGGMATSPLRIAKTCRSEGGFLLEGLLECTDARCRAAYPVMDGVPVVLKDVAAWWRRWKPVLAGVRTAGGEVRDYFDALDRNGPDGIDRKILRGWHMDFHYGEYADAAAEGAAEVARNRAYWKAVAGMARPDDGKERTRSLDLGCSVGRLTFEMARLGGLAVGVDLDFGAVSDAARIHRERRFAYERKERGRTFRRLEAGFDAPRDVLFLVGDALDPPFSAESFDLVGALNLLDNVDVPLILLGQMDALLRRGGTLLLGSPYEWRTDIAAPGEWLETDELEPAAFLRRILEGAALPRTGFRYAIAGEMPGVEWIVRGHARSATVFRSHLITGKKG